MSDRYASLSHEQLWQQLMAGKPEQVKGLASDWSSLKTTLDDLSATLDKDLERLRPSWTGTAGAEFQNRLDAIVKFSADLATDAADIGQSLNLLAAPLREAQQKAEDPAETDDLGRTLTGAAVGGAIAGPAGAALGGLIGHKQDKQQQEDARLRMVKVVSGLAGDYIVGANDWARPTTTPPDLPGDLRTPDNSPNSAPTSGGVSGGPGTGGGGGPRDVKVATTLSSAQPAPSATGSITSPGTVLTGPGTSAPGPVPGTGPGSTPGGVTTAPGTVLSGIGGGGSGGSGGRVGNGGSALGAARPTATGGTSNAGGLFGPGGVPAGGAGALSAGGRIATAPGGDRPHPTTGRGVGQNGSGATRMGGAAAGGSEAGSGRGGAGRTSGLLGQPGGHAVQSGMMGGNSRRGSGGAEEPDEQLTWLTEDDLPWQHDEAAPPVLGADPR